MSTQNAYDVTFQISLPSVYENRYLGINLHMSIFSCFKWSSLNNKLDNTSAWKTCCYFTFHKSNFNNICSFFHTFEVKIGEQNCNIVSDFRLEKWNWAQEFPFPFRKTVVLICLIIHNFSWNFRPNIVIFVINL